MSKIITPDQMAKHVADVTNKHLERIGPDHRSCFLEAVQTYLTGIPPKPREDGERL